MNLHVRPTLPIAAVCLIAAAGCGGPASQLTLTHRHAPNGEARIVVLPVDIADGIDAETGEGVTLATLYSTELLRSYEILDYRRFQKLMEQKGLDLETILENGAQKELIDELGIDGVLLSQVYSWKPGVPGILFLAKPGRVGFVARLIDLRTGSVIWSANHVRETDPADGLSLSLTDLFRELAEEMPHQLAPF